jgi:glycosyltransferase involved in cell wall biosynthesis
MIGDGPLFKNVESRIKNLGLQKNVKLFGYLFDGPKKYSIFARSKIVVHPAFYDSGGMASAEAMAFGLPCVGFNLEAYKSYYPKGMVKAKLGDLDGFAREILKFLRNEKYRLRVGKEAKEMIEENWDWRIRAYEVAEKIIG